MESYVAAWKHAKFLKNEWDIVTSKTYVQDCYINLQTFFSFWKLMEAKMFYANEPPPPPFFKKKPKWEMKK